LLFASAEPHLSAQVLSARSAADVLTYLRHRTIPQPVAPPAFTPAPRQVTLGTPWLIALWHRLAGHVLVAVFLAAAAILAAPAIVRWAPFSGDASVAASTANVTSSPGTTSPLRTRVADLSVSTFLSRVPFVQRGLYLRALTGGAAPATSFVREAREAALAQAVQDVSAPIAIRYLADAVKTQTAVDAWREAAARAQREAAARRAATAPVWQRAPLVAGTRVPGARVTFYACLGNGFCGNMASGQAPFHGAAACSYNLPFGTKFVIVNDPLQRVFVCLDRGALAPTWVDIWFYDAADGWAFQSIVGTVSDIIIVE
jgi:hypothetical protein